MGGEISIDDLHKLPQFNKIPEREQKIPSFLMDLDNEADCETATMAVHALTAIALETKNSNLAESCRDLISDILAEYAPSRATTSKPERG